MKSPTTERHQPFTILTFFLLAGAVLFGTPATAELVPVPQPAEGTVEASVAAELAKAHENVEALATSDAPTEPRAQAFAQLGQLYAAYELWDAAAACFENTRSLAPESFPGTYLLAYTRMKQAELDAAAGLFEHALELDPESLPAHLRLGEVLLDLDRPADAGKHFTAALELDADSAAAHFGLARALDARGETEAAVEHYEKVLELEAGATVVHYPLAQAYRRIGNTDEARDHLAQRGDTPVSLPDALVEEIGRRAGGGAFHQFRGDQAVLAGDLEAAAAAYEQAVKANPKSFYARKLLGLTLYQLGRQDEARKELVEAIDLDPGEAQEKSEKADLHFTIGSMAANQGVLWVAEEHYLAALAYDDEHIPTIFQMGNLRGRQKRFEGSIVYFDRVLELEPNNLDALFQRATIQMDLGNFAAAIDNLETRLELLPDDETTKKLLEIARERAEGKTADDG